MSGVEEKPDVKVEKTAADDKSVLWNLVNSVGNVKQEEPWEDGITVEAETCSYSQILDEIKDEPISDLAEKNQVENPAAKVDMNMDKQNEDAVLSNVKSNQVKIENKMCDWSDLSEDEFDHADATSDAVNNALSTDSSEVSKPGSFDNHSKTLTRKTVESTKTSNFWQDFDTKTNKNVVYDNKETVSTGSVKKSSQPSQNCQKDIISNQKPPVQANQPSDKKTAVCVRAQSKKAVQIDQACSKPHVLRLECLYCGRVFTRRADILKHVSITHGELASKHRTCDVCGKIFKHANSMKSHRTRQHVIVKLTCIECSAKFRTKCELKYHMENKHLPPVYKKCSNCSEEFINDRTLKEHLRLVHSIGNRQTYLCAVCGKCFKSNEQLSIHLLIHSGKKLHVCEVCGKSFRTESNLYQHARTHSDVRPFKCGVCESAFRIKHHLRQHMAVHGMASVPKYGKRGKKTTS